MASAYNLIAITFHAKHDDVMSFSYFIKGLSAANEASDERMLNILYNNIAGTLIYYKSNLGIKYLEKANNLSLLTDSSHKTDEVTDGGMESKIYNYEDHLSITAMSHLNNRNYKLAYQIIEQYLSTRENHTPAYLHFAFYYIQIACFHEFHEIEKVCEIANQLIEYLHSNTEFNEESYFGYYCVAKLLELDFLDMAKEILDTFSIFIQSGNKQFNEYDLCKLYIQYYSKTKNQNKLNEFYKIFYQLHMENAQMLSDDFVSSISTRQALEQQMELNQYYQEDTFELQQKSEKDALTGLFNRYGLQKYYENYFLQSQLSKYNFGIMLIDIDHFKVYNDTYGHLKGDQCIINIAQIIHTSLPSTEYLCARFGGDEFCVMACNVNKISFKNTAKQIIDHIRKEKLQFDQNECGNGFVSLSLGGIICIPSSNNEINDFFATADSALYAVKNKSRNDYIIYDSISKL